MSSLIGTDLRNDDRLDFHKLQLYRPEPNSELVIHIVRV